MSTMDDNRLICALFRQEGVSEDIIDSLKSSGSINIQSLASLSKSKKAVQSLAHIVPRWSKFRKVLKDIIREYYDINDIGDSGSDDEIDDDDDDTATVATSKTSATNKTSATTKSKRRQRFQSEQTTAAASVGNASFSITGIFGAVGTTLEFITSPQAQPTQQPIDTSKEKLKGRLKSKSERKFAAATDPSEIEARVEAGAIAETTMDPTNASAASTTSLSVTTATSATTTTASTVITAVTHASKLIALPIVQSQAVLENKEPSMSANAAATKIVVDIEANVEAFKADNNGLTTTKAYKSPAEMFVHREAGFLDTDRVHGALLLLPDEVVLSSVEFSLYDSCSIQRFLLNLVSLGLYHLINRLFVSKEVTDRHIVYITNKRLIIKQEVVRRHGLLFLSQKLYEKQTAYSHYDLAYFCVEEVPSSYCFRCSTEQVLHLKFHKYPSMSQVPESIYQSPLGNLYRSISDVFACTYADTKVGKALEPLQPFARHVQHIESVHALPSLYKYVTLFICFSMKLLYRCVEYVYTSKSTDVDGDYRFSVISDSNSSTDFVAFVAAVAKHSLCSRDGGVQLIDVSTLADVKYMYEAVEATSNEASHVNDRRSDGRVDYQHGTNFIHNKRYLPLIDGEEVIDACSNNPLCSTYTVCALLSSLGLYYFTDIYSRLRHTESIVLTNRRIIRHSMCVTSKGMCLHSRCESYMFSCTDISLPCCGLRCTDTHAVAVITSSRYGDLELSAHSCNKLFLSNVFKFLSSNGERVMDDTYLSKVCVLSDMVDSNVSNAVLSMHAIEPDEVVEASIGSRSSLRETCMHLFCCVSYANFLIATDKGVYIEVHQLNYSTRQQFSLFIPYIYIQSISWSNCDRRYDCLCNPTTPCDGSICCNHDTGVTVRASMDINGSKEWVSIFNMFNEFYAFSKSDTDLSLVIDTIYKNLMHQSDV